MASCLHMLARAEVKVTKDAYCLLPSCDLASFLFYSSLQLREKDKGTVDGWGGKKEVYFKVNL